MASKLKLQDGGSKNGAPPKQPAHEPGIYEVEIAPSGQHWYTVVMPNGAVGSIHVPDEFWDEDYCARLWKQFDRKARTLKVVP